MGLDETTLETITEALLHMKTRLAQAPRPSRRAPEEMAGTGLPASRSQAREIA